MARVHHVKNARKSKRERACGRCDEKIEPGDSYYWWANRVGRSSSRKTRCSKHAPRASEITQSPYRSQAYALQEGFDDLVKAGGFTLSDISSAVEEAADEIENDIAQALDDAAQNMEDGFGHSTYQSDELQERAENFRGWAEELRSAGYDIGEDAEDATEEELDNAVSAAEQAFSGCPE